MILLRTECELVSLEDSLDYVVSKIFKIPVLSSFPKSGSNSQNVSEKPAKKVKTDEEPVEGLPTKEGANFTIVSWNVAGMRAWVKVSFSASTIQVKN
ncbi:unnamed protein product [Notodromas monacha]|uniref:Uncharacterized protein n=1 Tax=Notodromas monacha TaxID=399045 RepID=A0A7R9C233_9CRUS|nr:unnamed protein product [Notodromas monacha]CAG0924992.1 unnamed protein product [Notodromas monacha]